jgi:hypothetical protein
VSTCKGNLEVRSFVTVEFLKTRESYSVLWSITQQFALLDCRTVSPVTVEAVYLSYFDC